MSELKRRGINNAPEEKKEEENIPEHKYHQELSSGDSLAMRIYSRVLVFISLIVVIYFSFKDENVITFARQTDTLPGKGEVVQCSPEYLNQVDKYEGCGPKECKRFITDQVVSQEEAANILDMFTKVTVEVSQSPVRISDIYVSKDLTPEKEDESRILTKNDYNAYNVIKEKIKQSMVHHFGLDPSKIYYTGETYFSAITSESFAVSSTSLNEYQKSINDEDNQGIHYTTILYLGDYNKDFKGGRFVFVDNKVNKTVEPKKGRINMFTSGRENFNYVEKVTHGIRYAIAYSYSCDKNNAEDDNNI